MGTDRYGAKKRRSTGHKLQMEAARAGRAAPAAPPQPDQENIDPAPMFRQIKRLEVRVSTAEAALDMQKEKTSEARTRCQNTRRREDRARNSNSVLQNRLTCTEALKDELLATQLSLTDSDSRIDVLNARNSTLSQKAKAAAMRATKVKKASTVFHLQENGVISQKSRELVTDLVALHNVPVSKVLGVIKSVAQTIGITVAGSISERSVGRVVLEGGLIAQAQVIHESQHARDIRLSGDGTSLDNIQQESKFLNFTTTLYSGDDAPGDHVNRFLGINTAVNHTAETQLQGWKDVNEEMHEVYNTTIGLDNPVDPDTLPPKFTGMNSDHAADQQKLGRGVGGPRGWKEQCDRKIRGEKELRSWDPQVLLPFILAAASKKIEAAGGIDVFTALPLAEQDTLNKLMFIDVCVQVGKETFDAMSPEEQRATDLFIWAGCCMHKELNAVKGGNAAMTSCHDGHQAPIRRGSGPPIQLMNKDNKAAATAGSSDAKARAEAVSEGGGVKLTSLAGMLFHHKDKKKGEGALFQIWFQDALGYNISYPDTSNTHYQSHCEATGMLLLHRTLFLRYLEHMRDRKGKQTELLSLSHPYLSQVRGPAHSEMNLLDLGPLHARVKGFCRDVIANPDLILSPDASWKTASMDGKPWDNPELFYKISSRQSELPRVRECLVAFFGGALETWERFTADDAEGGIIAGLSADERERAWLPTTNDVNEGTLGELRTGSRHAPNMTLQQHNARKMYKRNNTKKYRPLLLPKHLRLFRAKARMVDSSGLTRQRRVAQQAADDAVVDQKRDNDRKKATKLKAVNAALDEITPWNTGARARIDPSTGKQPKNQTLDDQLAWYRRAEKVAKGAKSDIPGVSKLTKKADKIEALVEAIQRYRSQPSEIDTETAEEDEGPMDDIDSDVDMELGY
ncbi:hypothetical protein B0H11DRAFT_2306656 [Mycena galericulata]|nr:hypothetical protein B0H11DRAFT_2306656 [Mycena galericulata]